MSQHQEGRQEGRRKFFENVFKVPTLERQVLIDLSRHANSKIIQTVMTTLGLIPNPADRIVLLSAVATCQLEAWFIAMHAFGESPENFADSIREIALKLAQDEVAREAAKSEVPHEA